MGQLTIRTPHQSGHLTNWKSLLSGQLNDRDTSIIGTAYYQDTSLIGTAYYQDNSLIRTPNNWDTSLSGQLDNQDTSLTHTYMYVHGCVGRVGLPLSQSSRQGTQTFCVCIVVFLGFLPFFSSSRAILSSVLYTCTYSGTFYFIQDTPK